MTPVSKEFAADATISHYRIVSKLGAGGMGEVYRARDTRLNRDVAIKILPAHLSTEADIRLRFEREAHAISNLSHPNICTLHDIGHQDGIDYLVLEYIEGESLADRLAKGRLPIEQVLRLSVQIADALSTAHRSGIVHRDLKPANIMLAKSGAKLLDFGLAKVVAEQEKAPSSVTSLPTERHQITAAGTILGTFQYMAPEQLEGREADARTDLFALGAVIYEMATGTRAFTGKTQASLIGAILRDDPPSMSSVQPMTPPALDRVVKACLAKEPDDRWQSAHDVMLQLQWIAEGSTQPGAGSVPAQRNREKLWMSATGALIVITLFALLMFVLQKPRHDTSTKRVMKLSMMMPEKTGATALGANLWLSPDGSHLAFIASYEGRDLVWVRPLDSLTAHALPGTEAATPSGSFWSADSRFIGFFSGGKLKKIDISGGPPQTICDAQDGRGGAWNRDGVIVFALGATSALYRVSAAGGEPVPVTTLDQSRQEISHRWPCFLPDGRHFIYLVRSSQPENTRIYVGSLDSKETKPLLTSVSSATYAPPGVLLFTRNETLLAQSFDADKLQLHGEPVKVAEPVGFNKGLGLAAFSVSENGILVYRSGGYEIGQLLWFDRSGNKVGQLGPTELYLTLCMSPDEKRIAIDRVDGQTGTTDIWLFDLARGIPSRFTTNPAPDWYPLWSPDGNRIVFTSNREGSPGLYQKNANGVGSEDVILRTDENKVADDWSPDGKFIICERLDSKTRLDLWLLPMTGDRQPVPFLQTEFNEQQAQFSPDGKWIAYTSDESGTSEVYVQAFPASGGKWRISTAGGCQPQWRRDGKELFFITPDRKLMAVDVKTGTAFEAGVPKPLFDTRIFQLTTFRNNYVVSRDGQRFLINSRMEDNSAPFAVVLNWTSDLK